MILLHVPKRLLALALKEAKRLNHAYVGTEHLLLGLIELGQGVAVNVLKSMGLDLDRVRMEVEQHVGPHPEAKMVGNIPYTPRVKKVLALAGKQAEAFAKHELGQRTCSWISRWQKSSSGYAPRISGFTLILPQSSC
jgi:ATP-dependent Clp protease ATP-binding subunit ClpC